MDCDARGRASRSPGAELASVGRGPGRSPGLNACARRTGSFYLVLAVGAILLIGMVAGLQLQMDQQMARARRLKGSAESALLARQGLEEAARRLTGTGGLPARFTDTPQGGELVVVCDGPKPAGSRKYVVFARARYSGAPVTMIADLRFGSPRSTIANRDVLYQDIDVDNGAARATLVAGRAKSRRELSDRLRANRGHGPAFPGELTAFFARAAGGTLPRQDQTRMVSALSSRLTTEVP